MAGCLVAGPVPSESLLVAGVAAVSRRKRPADGWKVGFEDLSKAALRRLRCGPGVHWDSERRATDLGAYMRHRASGDLSVCPPMGYLDYEDDLCSCLLHLESGVLVRRRPIQPTEFAEHFIVLYFYAGRAAFEAICGSDELPNFVQDSSFRGSVWLTAHPPDVCGTKQAILLDASADAVASGQGCGDVAHYCVPVLVPEAYAADALRLADAGAQRAAGVIDIQDDGPDLEVRALTLSVSAPTPAPAPAQIAPSAPMASPSSLADRSASAEAVDANCSAKRRRQGGAEDESGLLAAHLLAQICGPAGRALPGGYEFASPGVLSHTASGISLLAAPLRAHLAAATAAADVATAAAGSVGCSEELMVLYCYVGEAEFSAAACCLLSGGALSFELHALLAEGGERDSCVASSVGVIYATSTAPSELTQRGAAAAIAGVPLGGADVEMGPGAVFCVPLAVPRCLAADVTQGAEPKWRGRLPPGGFGCQVGRFRDIWAVSEGGMDSEEEWWENCLGCLRAADWRVRRAALRLLARAASAGDERAIESVADCLEDEDGRVKVVAEGLAACIPVMFAS